MLKPEDSVSPDNPNATPGDEVSSLGSKSRPDGSVDAEVSELLSARRSEVDVIGADNGTS
jgi:hypothetical protein